MSRGVIVWEYMGDIPGLYAPYSDKVSNYIEEQYNKNPLCTIELKNIDPILKSYDVDLTAKKQIHKATASQREIRRTIYDLKSTIGKGVVWEWLTDQGWVTYDIESLDAIEDAFAKSEDELDLATLTFKLPNIVLVQKGYQKNKSSGFVRPVQRRACAYKSNVVRPQPARRRTTDAQPIKNKAPGKSQSAKRTPKHQDVSKFCILVDDVPAEEDCAICLVSLKDEDGGASSVVEAIVQLKKCKHMFHESCMEAYCKQGQQNGCIQCPVCKKIHGVKTGNQPPGDMLVSIDTGQSVAGYQGCGMITITYNISSGTQGPKHPHPGQPYITYAFPRTGYLPANDKGKKVLKLLDLAWKRKLIFTVGTSSTTGMDNAVIWNEIHHKTSPRDNRGGHGYPDPKYLDNVIEELKQHGVTEEDIDGGDDSDGDQ